MITILACAAIGLAMGMVVTFTNQDEDWPWVGKTFYVLFGGIIGIVFGAILGVMLAAFIGIFLPTKWIHHDTIGLQSFHDACGSPGRTFLVTGGSSGDYFYCTRVQPQESHRPGAIDSDKKHVGVFEEERGDGVLVTYKSEFTNPQLYRWGINPPSFRYEFHVPPGTFIRLFPWGRVPTG